MKLPPPPKGLRAIEVGTVYVVSPQNVAVPLHEAVFRNLGKMDGGWFQFHDSFDRVKPIKRTLSHREKLALKKEMDAQVDGAIDESDWK